MNYDETMEYIHSFYKFGSKLGLTRIERLLKKMGSPEKSIKIIHVAGTNGKGSVVNILGKILEEEGYKVGVYTSPYLEYFEERIKINGESISKSDLSSLITRIKPLIDEVVSEGFDSPTEFEVITAAMFLYYKEKAVDYAVVEVGLGGRFDATNVITPILAIITSVSLDHMNILGNTISEIAFEKAGIIKKNVPLCLYPESREAEAVILKKAAEMEAEVYKVSDEYNFLGIEKSDGKYYQSFSMKIDGQDEIFTLSLLGQHQIKNCMTAIEAALVLNKMGHSIRLSSVKKGAKNTVHNGRFEILKDNPKVIIDGAHNMDGVVNLVSSVKKYFRWRKLILIAGILKDKEFEEMVKQFSSISDRIICLSPKNDRALSQQDLKNQFLKEGKDAICFSDYKEAYEYGYGLLNKDDILLIAGSLYMIGEIRKIINS
ncbi:MAG: bifunctional folylpolyglutamate synthase/dihydrofolate synthase [Bacillota bacterium]|nr:bifunctional folylpolyglutamate synthase/dihydrofolate synthase [Bacillota bacterium]